MRWIPFKRRMEFIFYILPAYIGIGNYPTMCKEDFFFGAYQETYLYEPSEMQKQSTDDSGR